MVCLLPDDSSHDDGPQTDDLGPEFRSSDHDHSNEAGVRALGPRFARKITQAFFPRRCPPRKRRVRRQDNAETVRSGFLPAPVTCSSGLYPSRRRISSGGWSAMPRLVASPTSTVNVVTPDNVIASGTGNAAKS